MARPQITQLFIEHPKKYVILTQNKIGQETDSIQHKNPKLWSYLNKYKDKLDARKSKIYTNSPQFAIFGVGDYSFAPYKVAISGFYKKPKFCLLFPIAKQPIILDDTCYFLFFEEKLEAILYWVILNSDLIQKLLDSIVFKQNKRPYTKRILMRLDFQKIFSIISEKEIEQSWKALPTRKLNLSLETLLMSYRSSKESKNNGLA